MVMEHLKDNITISPNHTVLELSNLVWYFMPTVVSVPPLGIPTNALVIRLLLHKPGICSTSEIFTLNQALFNMLFCFMFLAEYIRFVCNQTMEASNFLAWGLNQGGGPILLCMLGFDSYMAVCHPLVYLRLKNPKLRLSLCSLVCFITTGCCCLVKVASRFKWTVIFVLLSSSMAIISICNILILKSLRQTGPNKKELHPVKKRAFKIVLNALMQVNFHYLPPLGEYLLKEYGPWYFKPFSVFTGVSYFALSMGSFVQPLSYLVRTNQLSKIGCHCGSTAKAKTVATV